jgi:hypothetical protein
MLLGISFSLVVGDVETENLALGINDGYDGGFGCKVIVFKWNIHRRRWNADLLISHYYHSHIGTPTKTRIYLGRWEMMPNLTGCGRMMAKEMKWRLLFHGKHRWLKRTPTIAYLWYASRCLSRSCWWCKLVIWVTNCPIPFSWVLPSDKFFGVKTGEFWWAMTVLNFEV